METVNNTTIFESKIKPILLYVGTIGATAMSVAYIILMFVLILGFKASTTLNQAIIFAVINAVVGFIIMQFLKVQGIDFAKQIDKNKKIIDTWNRKQPKKRKSHSISFFWMKTVAVDIVVKVLTIVIMTSAIIYIVIEGSSDYNMLLMSVVNLIMFICFGFLSLVKAYDFFNNSYIPYLEEKIDEREMQESLEVVKKKLTKQGNDMVYSNRRVDLLEPSDNHLNNGGDSKCEMVGGNNNDNSVLVCPADACAGTSNRTDLPIEENTQKNKKQGE